MYRRYSVGFTFLALSMPAFAIQVVTVNCSGGGANYTSISAAITALKTLPVSGNAEIQVAGTCVENVVIDNFADLTLVGQGGAAVLSPNSTAAIRIDHSNKIIVRGFTMRGGSPVVQARRGNGIVIESCTVGSPSMKGPGSGIRFEERAHGFIVDTPVTNFAGAALFVSSGSIVTFRSSIPVVLSNSLIGANVTVLSSLTVSGKVTVENNSGNGLTSALNSTLHVGLCNPGELAIRGNQSGIVSVESSTTVNCPAVIENNTNFGVLHALSGTLSLFNAVVRNNGSNNGIGNSAGIHFAGTSFQLNGTAIEGNKGPGVVVSRGSNGSLSNVSVQGNLWDGVLVTESSVVEFFNATLSGNSGRDLLCNTGANAFGDKAAIAKMSCPGFSSSTGPKPYIPVVP